MDLQEAIDLAKREKVGLPSLIDDVEISIKEACEIMERSVNECWFDWITGREALKLLKDELEKEERRKLKMC